MMRITFMLVVLIIMQWLIAKYYKNNALDNVSVKRYFSKRRIREGETLEIVYEVYNDKRIPLINLTIIDSLPDSLSVVSSSGVYKDIHFNDIHIDVPGHCHVLRRYSVIAKHRGYISSYSLTLRIKDIFGLKTSEKIFRSYDNLYIYPSMRECKINQYDMITKEAKPVKSLVNEDPLIFYSIRPYEAHDSVRKVNWNKTAQIGRLMVNEYENVLYKNICLFVNVAAGDSYQYDNENVENLLRVASYVIFNFISNGYAVGLIVNCATVIKGHENICLLPDMGFKHLARCNDMLSMADLRALIDTRQIVRYNSRILTGCSNIIISCEAKSGEDVLKIFKSYNVQASLLLFK